MISTVLSNKLKTSWKIQANPEVTGRNYLSRALAILITQVEK